MQSKRYQRTNGSLSSKIVGIIFSLAIVSILIYGITWYIGKGIEEDKQLILANPVECRGVVVGLTSYKGKGATIEYFVNGQKFQIKPSISNEFYDSISIGDSVAIIYSKVDPQKAMLKYKLAAK